MSVTYKEYSSDKISFFNKHHSDFNTYTSMMDNYGRYHKEYCFTDGAVWYEIMSPQYMNTEEIININNIEIKVNIEIKMFCTEYFSTDNASSKYYYERFNHTNNIVKIEC